MSLFEGGANAEFAAHFRSHFPLPDSNTALSTKPLSSAVKPTLTYNVMYQVGVGAYGFVFKAKCHQTGDVVALKKIKLDASQNRHGFPSKLFFTYTQTKQLTLSTQSLQFEKSNI